MANKIAGLFLVVCGLWFARFTYRGVKAGNMTMSAIAPAYRDKQPLFFWAYTGLGVVGALIGVIAGLFALLAPS